MGIPVEGVYNPHFNFSIELDSVAYTGYFWNPQSFGGMTQDPAEGDIIIAMVAARTDNEGTFSPNLRVADDSGNERTDWTQVIDNQFDDDGSGFAALNPAYTDPHFTAPLGSFNAVALFVKVWGADDDPATYNAYFTAINADGDGTFADSIIAMYCIHGGDGHWTSSWNDGDVYTIMPSGELSMNFGEGHSWGQKIPSVADGGGVDADGGLTFGYTPGRSWAVIEGTGASVYCMCMFGFWSFFLAPEADPANIQGWFFEPDDFDRDWGYVAATGIHDPLIAFSIQLQDVLQQDVIRVSHNVRRAHRISVS